MLSIISESLINSHIHSHYSKLYIVGSFCSYFISSTSLLRDMFFLIILNISNYCTLLWICLFWLSPQHHSFPDYLLTAVHCLCWPPMLLSADWDQDYLSLSSLPGVAREGRRQIRPSPAVGRRSDQRSRNEYYDKRISRKFYLFSQEFGKLCSYFVLNIKYFSSLHYIFFQNFLSALLQRS